MRSRLIHPRTDSVSTKPIAKSLIYILAFLFALHLTPAIYINSNFLQQFISTDNVGYIFSLASLLTIAGFVLIRPILHRFGNYKTFLGSLTTVFIALALLTVPEAPAWLYIAAFTLATVFQALCFFHMDIFLEHYSKDSETGMVRGIFLTAQNLSFVIGPLIAGLLLTDHDFWKIYLFGIILLIPVFYIAIRYLRNFSDPKYTKPHFAKTSRYIFKNKDLYNVFAANGLLFAFYSWMIIYTPIYLHTVMGFPISSVTTIMGIALVAFIILQPPLGYIADEWIGEKEMLIAGFIIIAGSTTAMSFLESSTLWHWAALLFITRVGASMVEIMSEAYFFKKVDSGDMNIVSFFRIVGPLMYTAFPILASVLLIFIDLKFIFMILGAIMLYGVRYGLAIKDTL